ncbi:MAG TPA: TetR/AcrR family transcriptional regulator [Miltoncostaeaceae bacterium]|nr:TetR/AcrR family transcriptional regulator [Miltoncostaeaceae bacterium]
MTSRWSEAVEGHRSAVQEAVLDAVGTLVAAGGPRSVTMAAVARTAGVGRATLYRNFADADALLQEWHAREVRRHVGELVRLAARSGRAWVRLERVLLALVWLRDGAHAPALHLGGHVASAQDEVHGLLCDLLSEAVKQGDVRGDIRTEVLAGFCLAALSGGPHVPARPAARDLVGLVLCAVRAPSQLPT